MSNSGIEVFQEVEGQDVTRTTQVSTKDRYKEQTSSVTCLSDVSCITVSLYYNNNHSPVMYSWLSLSVWVS